MTKRSGWIIAGLVLLSVLGAGLWFLSTHHRVEKTIWKGFKGNARYDKYYITEQLLKQKGIKVTREKTYARLGFSPISADYDTIWLSHSANTLGQSQTTALLDWVEAGGQLVLEAGESNYYRDYYDESSDNDDALDDGAVIEDSEGQTLIEKETRAHLLKSAGIAVLEQTCTTDACQQCRSDLDEDEAFDTTIFDMVIGSKTEEEDAEAKAQKLLSKLTLKSGTVFTVGEDKLVVSECPSLSLNAYGDQVERTSSIAAKCSGDLFASFTYGKGNIVVYNHKSSVFSSELSWWNNENIFTNHHATYLFYLLNLSKPTHNLLWYESETYLSIWAMIWQYGRYVLWSVAALLMLWVWRYSRRFGSLLIEDERQALSLDRHLNATGQFYYNNEGRNLLVVRCFEQLDADIAHHIPLASRLSKAELAEQVAKKTGVQSARILPILQRHYPQTDAEFTQLIYTINQIRKRL